MVPSLLTPLIHVSLYGVPWQHAAPLLRVDPLSCPSKGLGMCNLKDTSRQGQRTQPYLSERRNLSLQGLFGALAQTTFLSVDVLLSLQG